MRSQKSPTQKLVDMEYLTAEELAGRLRWTEQNLAARRNRGQGPPSIKVGGSVRYPLPWVEQWLQEQQEKIA